VALELPARVVPCGGQISVTGPSGASVPLSAQTTLLLDHDDLGAVHQASNGGGPITFTMQVDPSALPPA
jgi:hypothetical protein